ncbi:MAG: flagellar biosynthetic protein FliR [Chlamydiia bacterium]|nr:flagellar biosynthetic protein FliR [Chlamydiia bacterium]
MDDYLDSVLLIITSNPGGSIFCFASILARMVGFSRHVPFFGSSIKNSIVRNGLSFCMCALAFPLAIKQSTQVYTLSEISVFSYILNMSFQFMIGYILGYIISVPFFIAQTTGLLMDSARGSNSVTAAAGLMSTQTTVTGIILTNILIIHILLDKNLALPLYSVLINSFKIISYEEDISKFFESGYFIDNLINITQIFNQGILFATKFSAPVLTISLCSDLSWSLLNRLMPQTQITFLSVPLKQCLSLLVLYPVWLRYFSDMHALLSYYIDLGYEQISLL